MKKSRNIHVHYFAILREKRGLNEETIQTQAQTVLELYEELQKKYPFKISTNLLKVAINNEFADWSILLREGDHITFVPPVAGG